MKPIEQSRIESSRPVVRTTGLPFTTLALAGVLLVVGTWAVATYNRLVQTRQAVDAQWAQVESVYQRRADLVPNLVAATQGYLGHERLLFETLAQARQGYMNAPAGSPDRVEAANKLQQTIGSLLAIIERYPELKSRDVVLQLMDELAGTENRIVVERRRYNERVREYNQLVLGFPRSLIAGAAGFKLRPYFQAEADAASAPATR